MDQVAAAEPEGCARAAAIEAGADRPAAILIQDVRPTADAFAAAATGMPAEAWQRVVRYTAGQEPRADATVPSRLAEVLIHHVALDLRIHHVDLDLCYRPQDWPAWFANDMLSRTATSLTEGSKMTSPVRLAGTDTGNVVAIGAVEPDSPVISGPERELMAGYSADPTAANYPACPAARLAWPASAVVSAAAGTATAAARA